MAYASKKRWKNCKTSIQWPFLFVPIPPPRFQWSAKEAEDYCAKWPMPRGEWRIRGWPLQRVLVENEWPPARKGPKMHRDRWPPTIAWHPFKRNILGLKNGKEPSFLDNLPNNLILWLPIPFQTTRWRVPKRQEFGCSPWAFSPKTLLSIFLPMPIVPPFIRCPFSFSFPLATFDRPSYIFAKIPTISFVQFCLETKFTKKVVILKDEAENNIKRILA